MAENVRSYYAHARPSRWLLRFWRDLKTADVSPARHALHMIDLAISKCGHHCQVKLTYLWIFDGKVMKNTVIGFNRGGSIWAADQLLRKVLPNMRFRWIS